MKKTLYEENPCKYNTFHWQDAVDTLIQIFILTFAAISTLNNSPFLLIDIHFHHNECSRND